MKKNNNQTYKVKFEDLKARFNFSDEQDEYIKKRVNSVNRTTSIPRRVLERRSLDLQKAYIVAKQLDIKVLKELETVFNALKTVRKEVSIKWDYEKLLNVEKQVERAMKKHSLTNYSDFLGSEALMSVITGYQFY